VTKIADSGLLIAALDKQDQHHHWATAVLAEESPPWFVCEPVLTEITTSIGTPEPVLEMLRVGDLEIRLDLQENVNEVLALTKKYRDQAIDLADACVIRMSEILQGAVVYTVDRKDFTIYRRHGKRLLRCVFPH
jgi:predicted nucleic acid-binding protein